MPERQTLTRARRDKRAGKAPTTQAGEFIREEMHHIREGKHGARSPQQAIAIGLSKARRAGVELKPPAPGRASSKTRRRAQRDYQRGHGADGGGGVSRRRSAATRQALEREPRASASSQALSRATRSAAGKRSAKSRSAAARKASRTKGPARRAAAAKKGARTRTSHPGGRANGGLMRARRTRAAFSASERNPARA